MLAHITVVHEIPARNSARATGLVQASFLIGFAAGSPLFGGLITVGGFVAAWCVTGALCTAASLVALVERQRRVSQRPDGGAARTPQPGGVDSPGRTE